MSSSSIDKTVIFAVFVVGWCLCFHAPVKAEMDERASHDASAKEKEEEREKMLLYDKKNPLKVKAKAVIRGMARDLFFCLWISSACHSETISSTFTSDFGLLLTKTAFTVVETGATQQENL